MKYKYRYLISSQILIAAILLILICVGCKSDSSEPTSDITRPIISITSPGNASTIVDSVVIHTDASDNIGVVKVKFFIDGSLAYTCLSTPWQYNWVLQGVPKNTMHEIIANAYDAVGNVGISQAITVLVKSDTSNPVVVITNPTNNATIVDSILITANAFDNRGIDRLEILIDESRVKTLYSPPWQYLWDVQSLADSTNHTISMKGYDVENNSGTSSLINVLVRKDTTKPIIGISSPMNNSIVSDSALIQAVASDNRGVVRVEFYIDGNLNRTLTTPPWQYWWDVRAKAEHSLHSVSAKAYDAYDNTGISLINTVTVINNRALQFNGSTDYVRLPSSASLTSFGNKITIESWIKVSSFSDNGVIIASGNENEYSLAVRSDRKISVTMVQINPQLNHEFISKSTLTLNTWYHVAVSYNGSSEALLIDGVIDTSFSTSGNVSTSGYTENISIGAYSYNNHTQHKSYFNGTIDEVRIWNIGRTQSEIQATMNIGLLGTETGLMGNWPFNGNVTDLSPNGNNGTIFGTPVYIVR